MAVGPLTQVVDVVVPEIFTPYVQQLTEQKARLVQSGALARDAMMDALLDGGGLTFNVPSYRDLDDDADNVSTDDVADIIAADFAGGTPATRLDSTPLKIETSQEVAVRLSRNNSWSSADLTAALAGADPMNAIASRVAFYWTRRLQAAFISTWNGVIANNTADDSGDYTNDISGVSFVDGVTNFCAEAFLDAAVTMGDSMEGLTMTMVHSIVYNRMQKNNLIDFIPDARGEVSIPTFLGREVIVDDGLPNTTGVFDTWLFGAGATRLGVATPRVGTEVDRQPQAGNGGGQEILHSRTTWGIHPVGHAYVGTAPDGGPANGAGTNDLGAAASWDRRFPERKQINFARLVTRES
jgi:hypothetical protein